MILDKIIAEKKEEVAQRKISMPVDELKARIKDAAPARNFARALHRNSTGLPAVIAEVKKASPSKGVIRPDFDPESIAKTYSNAGASAISVLTDEKFFQGSLDYLRLVKATVNIPVLRKDFLIDDYQLYEARATGADAVLLIVAALEEDDLRRMHQLARELGMDALVEVHSEPELETAINIGADLIGINNRNLQTFEVSLDTTVKLLPQAKGRQLVSESGIFTREDMEKLGNLGVDAVLIGEAFMRESDIEGKLRELIR